MQKTHNPGRDHRSSSSNERTPHPSFSALVQKRTTEILVEKAAQDEAARILAKEKRAPTPTDAEKTQEDLAEYEEALRFGPLSHGEARRYHNLCEAQRLRRRSQY